MSNIPEPKKYGSMSQRIKKQHQPVLVYHSAEKMQNAIKSFPALLSHGNQSGQKRKEQFTPRSARTKRGESKFAGAKATAHPAQTNALDKTHQHHHQHHQQFQKGTRAPKCRPKRKKPPPVPKSQANPNLRPKTNSVPRPGECS